MSWGVAVLGAMLLALALASAMPARAQDDARRGAEALWNAYPLKPDGATASTGTARETAAASGQSAIREGRAPEAAIGSTDEPADSRLMLQLGMFIAILYVALLTGWFSASRGVFSVPAVLDVTGGLHRVRAAWSSSVAEAPPPKPVVPVRPRGAARRRRGDPSAVWTCEIAWRPGRVRSRFRAEMAPPGRRAKRVVAESRSLRWSPRVGGSPPTEDLVTALDTLSASLVAAGWEPVESGDSWSARRFVWRRGVEPPERVTLLESR